jgi:DTW domain-containing protein YfiP
MDALRAVHMRCECPRCHRSVKFFCYHCLWLIPELEGRLPKVRLPVPLTVLMDYRELRGKSTAVHAVLLSDDCDLVHVNPHDGGELETILRPHLTGKSALLFPDDAAITAQEVDWMSIERIIVIDGTWTQARTVSQVISRLGCQVMRVKLTDSAPTRFWRYQHLGPQCLSTIEAITRAYQEAFPQLHMSFEPLLTIFDFMYELIQRDYRENPERLFTSRHRSQYIRYQHP